VGDSIDIELHKVLGTIHIYPALIEIQLTTIGKRKQAPVHEPLLFWLKHCHAYSMA